MNIVLKSFKISKKLYSFLLIMLTVCFASLLILLNLFPTINKYINQNITDQLKNRDIIFTLPEELEIDKLKELLIEHGFSTDIYKDYGSLLFDTDHLGKILLQGIPLKYLTNKDCQVNICFIFPKEVLYNNMKLNLEKLIGENIEISYNSKKTLGYVLDIYNNTDYNGLAYTSLEIMEKLIQENKIYNDNSRYHIILENEIQVNSLLKFFQNINIKANLFDDSGKTEQNIYYNFKNLLFAFLFCIILFIIFILLITVHTFCKHEKENIAIMKAIGFTNREITKYITILFNKFFFLAFLISNVLVFIIVLVLKKVNILKLFSYFQFKLINCLCLFIITGIVFLLNIIYIKKVIKKYTITELIKK